jgi:hypothetical protein
VSPVFLGFEMKKKKKSTFGLRLDQLEDLFAVASGDRTPTRAGDTDERLAKTLRRHLTEVLPGNALFSPSSAKGSDNKQSDLTSLTGRSLLQVFFSPETSTSQLQVIKETSKRLTATSDSESELAVGTTIYHAAIASCLVHHSKKITQHSYEKLVESFTLLIGKKWMAFELVELFSQARRICKKKRRKK